MIASTNAELKKIRATTSRSTNDQDAVIEKLRSEVEHLKQLVQMTEADRKRVEEYSNHVESKLKDALQKQTKANTKLEEKLQQSIMTVTKLSKVIEVVEHSSETLKLTNNTLAKSNTELEVELQETKEQLEQISHRIKLQNQSSNQKVLSMQKTIDVDM